MTKYETLFLCRPDLPEEAIQAIVSRLSEQVANNEGKLAVVDVWGHRRLGYPVRYRGAKYARGLYILLTYLGGGRTVAELERTSGLLEDVMRFQTVKLEDEVDPATITEVTHTRRKDEISAPEEAFAEEEFREEEGPSTEETAAGAKPDSPPVGDTVPAEPAPALSSAAGQTEGEKE